MTALSTAAAALAAGSTVEFRSDLTSAIAANGTEPFVYWNHKFYWDETRREAQGIGLGTGFTNCTHALFSDDNDLWYATSSYDTPVVWNCPAYGHPYEWHFMSPDGTYWCKRSTEEALQYRTRADWSTSPWIEADKTPTWTAATSYPESIEWHAAMGKALFRSSSVVVALDTAQFLIDASWTPETLAIAPFATTANKSSFKYCTALRSCVAFGVNYGATQDNTYLIREDGTMETMAGQPPRWVMNGNVIIDTPDVDKYAYFVDDPLKQTGYLIERQPYSLASTGTQSRVWRMDNSGTAWNGGWIEAGYTDLFSKARSDSAAIGVRAALVSVPNYGVVWALRQNTSARIDSFLWKPPSAARRGSRIIKVVTGRDNTAPATPTTLEGVAIDDGTISLSCAVAADAVIPGAATSGTSVYRWYFSADMSNFTLLAETAAPSHVHAGLSDATTYYYQVSAVDFIGNESPLSDAIAVTTQAAGGVNDPPEWRTGAISLSAYPGQAISYTIRWGATPTGNDVWDINGDPLTFSEQATGTLALLGLSCSSAGVIAGTVPSGTTPQSVTAVIGASDGEFTATKSILVTVYEPPTSGVDPDYTTRAEMPGVFYATNWIERRRGAQGYTSADGTLTDQELDPTYYQTNPAHSDRSNDVGDGLGTNWIETDAAIAGPVGGACYGIRRLYRVSSRSVDGAVIAPWGKMPVNYIGGADSAEGYPGYHIGEKGTAGEGQRFKYVETVSDPLLGTATFNTTNRPCGRHFYLQFLIRLDRDLMWYRERHIRGSHLAGAGAGLLNKLVFVTGGQTSDQVAIVNGNMIGLLRPYFQNGNANPGWKLVRPHKGYPDEDFWCPAIDNAASGEPVASSTVPYESMLRRYGYSTGENQMTEPLQSYWSETITDPPAEYQALPGFRRSTHILPNEAEALGVDSYEVNLLSQAWRSYPYGGFDEATKKYLPLLNIPTETWAGGLEPDRWHVVEMLFSDQYDAPVNDSAIRYAVKEPCYPRFVALWAAPLGEAPKLLGYTNQGQVASGPISQSVGPGAIPSRLCDQNPILLKWQNSEYDGVCYSGWMVIGPSYHPSAMEPTATQFDVILYHTVTSTLREDFGAYTTNSNRTSVWASADGWGDDSTLGFTKGALAAPAYRPPLPFNPLDQGLSGGQWGIYHQAEILSTRLIGASATTPGGLVRQIHRVTMREALPLVPVAATSPTDIQDGFVAHHINDRKSQDKRLYYGPTILSVDPIPFPGHLGTPLPTPWRD